MYETTSATIVGSTSPSIAARRTAAADSASRPASCRRGTPASARNTPSSSRDAKMSATDSADSLRATRPSTSSDSLSRWWASSIDADRRNVVAGAGEDRQHPESDERPLGRSARSQAGGDEHRVALGGGDVVDVPSERAREPLHAPRTRARPRPRIPRPAAPGPRSRPASAASMRDVLPTPASPWTSSAPLAPLRAPMISARRASSSSARPTYPIESCYGPQTSGYATVGISPTFQTVSKLAMDYL